jgi:hypothetical protein
MKFETGEFYISEQKIFRTKVAEKYDVLFFSVHLFTQVLKIFNVTKYIGYRTHENCTAVHTFACLGSIQRVSEFMSGQLTQFEGRKPEDHDTQHKDYVSSSHSRFSQSLSAPHVDYVAKASPSLYLDTHVSTAQLVLPSVPVFP